MKQYIITYNQTNNSKIGYWGIIRDNVVDAIKEFEKYIEDGAIVNIYSEEIIEKKEEPDTDTKWIDDAREEYKRTQQKHLVSLDDVEKKFKKAILSHYPKK